MKTTLTATQTLKILKNELPLCFKKGAQKLPLALNIHQDILQHYSKDTRFSHAVLKQTISFYTQSTHYLKKIKAGAQRIDIKGRPQTLVTVAEEKYAETLLKKRASKV